VSRTQYRYACFECDTQDAVLNLSHPFDDVCAECGSLCEKVSVCEDCHARPCFDGVDYCIECAADECVKDPALIDEYTRSMQVAIARELAERLRPKLSVRQAA
jgi:hypothetical protein